MDLATIHLGTVEEENLLVHTHVQNKKSIEKKVPLSRRPVYQVHKVWYNDQLYDSRLQTTTQPVCCQEFSTVLFQHLYLQKSNFVLPIKDKSDSQKHSRTG